MPGTEANNTVLADPSKTYLQADGPYSSNASSRTGSEVSLHRVKNLPGYTTPVFKGKVDDPIALNVTQSDMLLSGRAACKSLGRCSRQGKRTYLLYLFRRF